VTPLPDIPSAQTVGSSSRKSGSTDGRTDAVDRKSEGVDGTRFPPVPQEIMVPREVL
jgi:hypothetical protein